VAEKEGYNYLNGNNKLKMRKKRLGVKKKRKKRGNYLQFSKI
jgi:hypothetical protein